MGGEVVEKFASDRLGSDPPRSKVYLDTNIISAWIKRDIRQEEFEALQLVLIAFHDEKIDLCTSHIAGEELDKLPAEPRSQHRLVYDFIRRVPRVPESTPNVILNAVAIGNSEDDFILDELRSYLHDESDARHVFQAVKNGVNVFLTVDGGIIAQATRIARHGLHVLRPTELIRRLNKEATDATTR